VARSSSPIPVGLIAETTTVLVAAGFIVSVVYNWGYMHALGLALGSLPLTTADQFRSGLLWFPWLLAGLVAYAAIEFQIRRVERGLTEEEIIQSSPNPKRTRKLRASSWVLLKWLAPLIVIGFVLFGDLDAAPMPMALAVLWIAFAEWCFSAPLVQQRHSIWLHAGFTILPIYVLWAFFGGYNAAVDATIREPTLVTVDLAHSPIPVTGKFLRSLDHGVLLLDSAGTLQVLSMSDVDRISYNKPYTPYRGLLCEWWNGFCAAYQRRRMTRGITTSHQPSKSAPLPPDSRTRSAPGSPHADH
jgi:hypothetical protein